MHTATHSKMKVLTPIPLRQTVNMSQNNPSNKKNTYNKIKQDFQNRFPETNDFFHSWNRN